MSVYTRDSADIYFLNDKNIVSSFEQTALNEINPVPSKDLLISAYDSLIAKVNSLNQEHISADNKIIYDIWQNNGIVSAQYRNITSADLGLNKLEIEQINLLPQNLLEISANYIKKSGDSINHLSVENLLTAKQFEIFQTSLDNHYTSAKINEKGVFIGLSGDSDRQINLSLEHSINDIIINNNTLCSYISNDVKISSDAIIDKIDNLNFDNVIAAGKIISSLKQQKGNINYEVKDLSTSDVKGLQNFIDRNIELSVSQLTSINQIESGIIASISQNNGRISLTTKDIISSDLGNNKLKMSQIDNLEDNLTNISSNYVKKSGDDINGNLNIHGILSSNSTIIANKLHSNSYLEVGDQAKANEYSSIALGKKASASHENSFVWNGVDEKYVSNKEDSFNINPNGGSEGFYIGTHSLCSLLKNELDAQHYILISEVNVISNVLSNDYNQKITTNINNLSTEVKTKYALSNDVYNKQEIDGKILTSFQNLSDTVLTAFALSNNVYSKAESNAISTALSSSVYNAGYMTPLNVDFKYDNSKIILSVNNGLGNEWARTFQIDTQNFEQGRFLESVAVGENPDTGKQALILIFKLEGGSLKNVYIDLENISKIYKSGFGINIADDLTISTTDVIAKSTDLNALSLHYSNLSSHISTDWQLNNKFDMYYQKNSTSSDIELKNEFAKYQLTGNYALSNQVSNISELNREFSKYTLTSTFSNTSSDVENLKDYQRQLQDDGPKMGIISKLSSSISSLQIDSVRELKFEQLLKINSSDFSNKLALSSLLIEKRLAPGDQIKNGTLIKVLFTDASKANSYKTLDNLSIGDGDIIVVEDFWGEQQKYILDVSELVVSGDKPNIWLIKAGVSRYEFENLNIITTNLKQKVHAALDGCYANISSYGYDMTESEAISCIISIKNMVNELRTIF